MKLPASEQNHNQLASIVRKLLLENKVPPKYLFSKEKHRKNRIQASARASNEWNLNYSKKGLMLVKMAEMTYEQQPKVD